MNLLASELNADEYPRGPNGLAEVWYVESN